MSRARIAKPHGSLSPAPSDAIDPRPRTQRRLFRVLALACLTTGGVGVIVPLLPTTPFLLLAAWAAQRGAPELAERIRGDARIGPALRAWDEERAIPRRARQLAVSMLAISAAALLAVPASSWLTPWLMIPLLGLLAAVAGWIATRPEPGRSQTPRPSQPSREARR